LARWQPWWVGWRLVALVIVGVHVAGTIGYMLIEGWPAWDAFYMTVITVTTVGYMEVHPLSQAGRAFTVLVLLTGVGAFFYAFTLFMTLLAEGGLVERRQARRLARMLDKLEDHFIVCGFGRMGEIIAHEFVRQRVPFVILERNPDRMHLAMEQGLLAVEADASHEDTLKRVHIDRARGFIAAVGTDAENVYAVLSARLLRPDLFIVGRAESEDSRAKLKRAGADRVISPYHLGGLQLAQTALRPAVVDFVQLATSSENMDLNLEQVHIGQRSALAGCNLVDAGLRQRYGVVVVGIRRVDGRMDFNPAPETAIQAGDDLVVLGRSASLKELEMAAADA
jgi:voltage-gated potassium channel